MKKLICILGILMLLPAWLTAQTPSTFNYQAVIQNKEGNVARNQQVSLQLDIIQGSESGFVVYSETRNVTTNSFGLINISIGSTSPEDFAAIDWSQGPYYIGTTVNGEYLGASLLQSVPYAIQAHSVINDMVNDEDSDPTNELELPAQTSADNNKVLVADGNGNVNWQSQEQMGATLTEEEVDAFVSNNGYQLSSEDKDVNPRNEIQDLELNGNILKITNNSLATDIDLSVLTVIPDYTTLVNKPANIDEDKTDDLLKTDLVNNLVTGGVNSALTAEQGKQLKTALDAKADTGSVYTKTETDSFLGEKVDVVSGKELSSNDYTDAEKIQLAGTEQQSNKNIAGGYVGLETDGKINQNYLPSAINMGTVYSAANSAEQGSIAASSGDICIRTDLSKTYIWNGSTWLELQTPTGEVSSVNGKTGIVVLGKAELGLGNVDNTPDLSKPVSLETQDALDLKANKINVLTLDNTTPFTPNAAYEPATKLYIDNQLSGVEKQTNKNIAGGYVGLETDGKINKNYLPSQITLGTVYTAANTIEQNQITAQKGDVLIRTDQSLTYVYDGLIWVEMETQTGQVTSVNGQTGIVSLTKSDINLGNADNTSDMDKPVSVATQAILDTKAASENVLTLDNTSPFTPDATYEPATKKYVDDEISTIHYLDKWIYDIDENDIIDNTEKVNGLTVETAVPTSAVFTDNQNLSEVLANSNNAGSTQIKGLAQPTDTEDATTKGYVDNITSALESLSNKNNPGGYVGLETDGKINNNYLPSLINMGTVYTAADAGEQAAISTPQSGDICIRTDLYKTYIYDGTSWVELQTPTGEVSSVNGKTGVVVLGKTDVNLFNVDNTSDANKPVSIATQSALDLKANTNNVLTLNNTTAFTPNTEYEPATKKYVDQSIEDAGQGDMTQAVYDRNANDIADDAERVNGLTVETAVPINADFSDDQSLSEVLTNGNSAGNKQIKSLASPTESYDATTKIYVDNQLSGVEKQTNKNVAGGYVGLETTGKINKNYLPSQISLGTVYTAASETEQNNLSPQSGDVCVRTDLSLTYIYNGSAWVELETQTGQVTSVNGQTGVVVLAKSDINLENVDNTTDLDKPVSTATQTALDTKAETNNVLALDNTTEFIPDANYEPATKKYVDDQLSSLGDGDMKKINYDINENNIVDNAETVEDNAITTSKIAGNAVTNEKIANGAVTTGKIGSGGAVNKILTTDALGNAQWEDRSIFTTPSLTMGSVFVGNNSNTAEGIDASGDAKVLIGNGTTLASQAISGDITLANDGTTTIGTDKITNAMLTDNSVGTIEILDDAVTTAKIGTAGATDANKVLSTDVSGNPQWEDRSVFTTPALTKGSIFVGNDSNAAEAMDAKGDAKVLIGNGTTLASQAISGDITLANDGTTTIGTDKITNAMLTDNSVGTIEILDDAVTTAKIGTAGATDANKVLSTDVSGNPQWEDRSVFTTPALAKGSIFVGNDSNAAEAMDAKGDAKILIGNGTTLASQTVSGDISIANDGTTAIGTDKISNTMMQDDAINTNEIMDDAVTTAKIGTGGATDANKLLSTDVSGNPQWENRSNFTSSTLNQGNIYLGNASNTAVALDAKGDAKILIGNGTTLASQTVSGDITITNNGTTTIGTDKITNSKMADNAINTSEIVNSAVTSAKIMDATIATTDIANDAITTAKIGTAGATDANKLLSTDVSGNPQWENRTNFTSSTLNQGNIYLGNASNTATALDAKGDAKILIGNGTTLASQTVSGDITIANNGTTTIGSDKITNAKMADNAINTNEIVNSAVTSAKILDATIATADIANDAVTTAKIGTAGATDANKLLSTDASGNPQWENRSNFTSSSLPKGNLYIGNDVGVATNIDAKGDGKLLIGNGSTVTSQSVTGDIALTNAGNMTINDNTITSAKIQNATITSTDLADNAVTLSKIYSSSSNNNKILTTDTNGNPYWENKSSFATANIAEGNILVGNSSGLAGALDVSGNGNLIIGNGTTVASQPVTGAIAINSNGVSSINSNQITNAMMQDNSINTAELASNAVSTVKIADNAVTVAKIGTSGGSDANKVMVTDASGNPIWNNQTIFAGSTLAEGNIYVGNSSNIAGPLVAKTTGQILIGNGTSVASQAVSGDISLSSSGTTAISSGVIVNSDVNNSAAIAGTKISPNFGSQNINTTGNLKIGNGTPTNTQDGEDAYIEGNVEVDGTVTVGAYTLPNTDGNNGDILKTDGSGTLTWASPAASVGIDVGDIKYSVRNTPAYTKDGITWLRLDGQTFSTSTYPSLFALLGTNTLPNAAGHVLGAAGSSTSTTSSRTIFDKTGEETHQMTVNEMPQHDHSFTGGAHSHGFTGNSHSHTFTGTPHNHAFTSNGHTHTTDLSHTHNFSGSESGTGHDHSIASKTFTTSSDGSHAHALPQRAYTASGVGSGDSDDTDDVVMYNSDGVRIDNYREEWTNSNSNHSHSVTVSGLDVNNTKVTVYGTTDSGGSNSKTSSISTVSGTTNNQTAGGNISSETVGGTVDATTVTGTIGNSGNGNAMNIMQPTLFVGYVYICAKIGY